MWVYGIVYIEETVEVRYKDSELITQMRKGG